MDLSYPPFETMDEIGKPTGISVRIAQALADFSAAFEALADIAGSQLRHCGAIGHQESADECFSTISFRIVRSRGSKGPTPPFRRNHMPMSFSAQ